MRPKRLTAVPAITASLLLTAAAPAATQFLHADQTASTGGDGASWCTAYKSLAAALEEAALMVVTSGDDVVVRIAQGTYKPDRGPGRTPGDQSLQFELENGVTIRGGYQGGCGAGLTRDIDLYPTVLSGNIGAPGDASDNSYRVLYGDYVGPSSSIDGLTIEGGRGDGSGTATDDSGAAPRLDWSSLTVSRCRFSGNAATVGGALVSSDTTLTMIDCVFESNEAEAKGGAVNAHGDGSLTLRGCTFTDNLSPHGAAINVETGTDLTAVNSTFSGGDAEFGGAIRVSGEGTVEVRGCTFTSNYASNRGGAIQLGQSGDAHLVSTTFDGNEADGHGGAVFKYDYGLASRLWISTCHFVGNSANIGGALHSVDDISLANSVFEANSAYTGGAISQVGQDPWFTQLTIYGNSATFGGAVALNALASTPPVPAQVTIINSIVYDNGSNPFSNDSTSHLWARTSDLEGCGGSGASWAWSHVTDDGGNIDADPQFVSANFPFDLASTSPCIDTGDNGWVPWDFGDVDEDTDTIEDLPWDIEGDARVIGSAVEMGANEYAGPVSGPGDADGDGDVDFADLLEILTHWGEAGGAADVDGNGTVGFEDVLFVITNWT